MSDLTVQCLLDRTKKQLEGAGYENRELGVTQAIVLGKHRDSGTLDRSNFDVVRKDLEKEFDDEVSVERFSHWGSGWVEYLIVRVLDDSGQETGAAKAAIGWLDSLADYPIADEAEYSDLEYEESLKTIKTIGGESEDAPKDWASEVFSWLGNRGRDYDSDSLRSKDVEEALVDLGWSQKEIDRRAEQEKAAIVDPRTAGRLGTIPPTEEGIEAYLHYCLPRRRDTYPWARKVLAILEYGRPERLDEGELSREDIVWAIKELGKRGWSAPGLDGLSGWRHRYKARRRA